MGVELRPLGVRCNIMCQYCYQNPQRDAGNVAKKYDVSAMKEAIEREGGPFTLFGGEPLLVPIPVLEELWAWGLERYGSNGIQTNGTLISDAHIELFRRYKVNVGVSIDGPGALNDVRWHGSLQRTRRSTERTLAAIERLCAEGMPPSLIITLHRGNATAELLPELQEWVVRLLDLGVMWFRLHLLESESEVVRRRYALTEEENLLALESFYRLSLRERRFRFDVFDDMTKMLMGDDRSTTCVWNACDPLTTRAVRGVEGFGQRTNCGRTNKDGIDFVKAPTEGFERYLALYRTPQDSGGCAGCRFFLMCKGQCPGTAIDDDWRNRTEHCGIWKALFERLEGELLAQGLVPVSTRPDLHEIEQQMLEAWVQGRPKYMHQIIDIPSIGSRDVSLSAAQQLRAMARELRGLARHMRDMYTNEDRP